METTIELKIARGQKDIKVKIDNSTDYKEFRLEEIKGMTTVENCLEINFSENGKMIEINNVELSGLSLQLFKEFINQ